jgi:hypothetical protein
MNELEKAFRHFISRDVIYITGGGLIIFAFCYKFIPITDLKLPTAIYLFLTGIAYVLGFVAQEVFSLIGIVSTGSAQPGKFIKWLFRHWAGKEWKINSFDIDRTTITIDEKANDKTLARIERIISLMQIGSTMAACFLVAGSFLLFKAIETKKTMDIVLTSSSFLLAIFLILFNRLQSAQRIISLYSFHCYITESVSALIKK